MNPADDAIVWRRRKRPGGGSCGGKIGAKRARLEVPAEAEEEEEAEGVLGAVSGTLCLQPETWRLLASMVPTPRLLHDEAFRRPSSKSRCALYLDSPGVAAAVRSAAVLSAAAASCTAAASCAAAASNPAGWLQLPTIAQNSARRDRATADLHSMLFVKGDCVLLCKAPPVKAVQVGQEDARVKL